MTQEDEVNPSKLSKVVLLRSHDLKAPKKRLPRFIKENTKPIVVEWEKFAKSISPASAGMTKLALRDHIFQLLEFIVSDMESSQTSVEQKEKSLGQKDPDHLNASAHSHAALRFSDGFDIGQMVSEYRALRASIIKLWGNVSPAFDAQDIDDLTRFNESIDEE